MTDPFSVTAGAASLVSLSLQLLGGCIKGFILLSTARNIGKDASTIVCMLNIEENQLIDWAQRAGLLTDKEGLDKRLNPEAVEDILQQLQDLLLDSDKLKRRYGLVLVISNTKQGETVSESEDSNTSGSQRVPIIVSHDTRRQILARAKAAQGQNIFKKFWWAAVDKEKIGKLVADIDFLIRGLWRLLDPWRQDDLLHSSQAIASSMISLNNRFDQLMSIVEALNSFPKESLSPRDRSLSSFAVSAHIKALRIGLGDEDQNSPPVTAEGAPNRLNLIKKLESLSRLKYKGFISFKNRVDVGFATYDEQKVFVEQKFISHSLRSKLLTRAENLAVLLNLPKDETFRSLVCRGVIEQDGKVSFVFHCPFPECEKDPCSLLDLFRMKDVPSLSVRVRLALQIVQTVQNFHRAGWLHKSLRSENVFFFPSYDGQAVEALLENPMLTGFAFARLDSPTEISEQPSEDPKSDIYRHPDALGEPSTSFNATMDVYSLGIMLLEIAEWRDLQYLVKECVDASAENVQLTQLAEVQDFLLSGHGSRGTTRLKTKMGDIYASACFMCLSGRTDGIRDEGRNPLGFEPSLLDIVVQKLKSLNI